jgi:hypothetical protein
MLSMHFITLIPSSSNLNTLITVFVMTTFRLKMENTFELLGTKNTAEDGG